jgi:hypothetical protein
LTLTRKNNDKKITGLAVILFSIALWWGSQSLIVKPSIALSDSEIPLETAPIVAEIAPVDDFGSKEGIMAVIQDKYPEIADLLICMVKNESTYCSDKRKGDNGLAYGCFQIHIDKHDITEECALDFECSLDWTAQKIKEGKGSLWSTYKPCLTNQYLTDSM